MGIHTSHTCLTPSLVIRPNSPDHKGGLSPPLPFAGAGLGALGHLWGTICRCVNKGEVIFVQASALNKLGYNKGGVNAPFR